MKILTLKWQNRLKKFGKNEDILQILKDYDKFLQIPASSPYFWKDSIRILDKEFVPTKEDIILSKLKTFGINEMKFEMDDILFTMVDVGGQRSERRKWYHCFDKISAIIYFCAIDEYDGKVLEEDQQTDRYVESFNLFQKLSGSEFFKSTPFILFLNKMDLLEAKLAEKPFEDFPDKFPDYKEFKENFEEKTDEMKEIDFALNYLEKNLWTHIQEIIIVIHFLHAPSTRSK